MRCKTNESNQNETSFADLYLLLIILLQTVVSFLLGSVRYFVEQ
jgi:hypothetical protein